MEVAKRGAMEKNMMIWNLLMKNHEDDLVEIFKRLDIFGSIPTSTTLYIICCLLH